MVQITQLHSILSKYKFSINNEKVLQQEIEAVLKDHRISYGREFFLDEQSIPDFMVEDIAIEVKIKGSKRDIYEQILRYSKHEDVNSVLLVTTKDIGNPPLYDNKKLVILNISKSLL